MSLRESLGITGAERSRQTKVARASVARPRPVPPASTRPRFSRARYAIARRSQPAVGNDFRTTSTPRRRRRSSSESRYCPNACPVHPSETVSTAATRALLVCSAAYLLRPSVVTPSHGVDVSAARPRHQGFHSTPVCAVVSADAVISTATRRLPQTRMRERQGGPRRANELARRFAAMIPAICAARNGIALGSCGAATPSTAASESPRATARPGDTSFAPTSTIADQGCRHAKSSSRMGSARTAVEVSKAGSRARAHVLLAHVIAAPVVARTTLSGAIGIAV